MVLRYKKLLKKIQKGESQGEMINSSLLKYGVYKYGVLRIGGRLRKLYLNNGCKHPVLLPKEEMVTLLNIHWCHSKCAHGGRVLTVNKLRSCGYWVICENTAVKKMIFHCVQCSRLCGRLVEQKMQTSPIVELLRLHYSHFVE